MMAAEPRRPSTFSNEGPQRLTSFDLLPPEEDESPNQYGLGGLFTRVKTVFGSSNADKSPAPQTTHAQPHPVASAGRGYSPKYPSNLATSSVVTLESSQKQPKSSPTPLLKTGSAVPGETSSAAKLPTPRHKPFPNTLRSAAVASTAPSHVTAHPHSASDVQMDNDDTRSLWADTIHEDEGRASLARASLQPMHPVEPSVGWTSIPGFPLSRELLADDTQSIRSSPSRATEDVRPTGKPIASLNASAESFRRLTLQGGAAASKEWWMPDELAKECSGCGAVFSMARRKHHCRCCGQIFCAKCTSNVLSGTKLGLSGLVRVCDFCSKMVQEYERARLGIPSDPKPADSGRDLDGRVRAEMISAPLEAAVKNAPQGRFAANALFSAVEDGGEEEASSPNHRLTDPSEPHQAPFRKRLLDDDHLPGPDTEPEAYPDESSIAEDGTHRAADDSGTRTPSVGASPLATSTIAFPSGDKSPSKIVARSALDEARAKLVSDTSVSHENRARLVSDAAVRAFRRSRLRSRLNTNDFGEKGSHPSIRDDFPDSRTSSRLGGAQVLNETSLSYLKRLLDQCLTRAAVTGKERWMEVLLPLTLKVIGNVKPNVYGQGRMMGLRKYVKIKRIPGGQPSECSLLSGYICSHNVASKSMARRLPLQSARVALVSFAMTAVRGEGFYTSLDSLAASEREYTRILVARVLALRPHLLLVKSQVSRLALTMLEQAGVIVVWNIPDSSMDAIARVTQSDIITSVDRLALSPRLGRCGSFTVDTYHSHHLQGKKRSFLRFSGTPKDLGCSVILRGGGQSLLGQIKSTLELCLLAAHNLRLEEALRETDVLSVLPEPTSAENAKSSRFLHDTFDETFCSPSIDAPVSAALRDYRGTLMSISAHIQIPPPYPLVRLQEERSVLSRLEEQLHRQPSDHDRSENDTTLTEVETAAIASESHRSTNETTSQTKAPGMDSERTSNSDTDTIGDSDQAAVAQAEITLDHSSDVEKQVRDILPSREQMILKTRCALARTRHAADAKLVGSMTNDGSLTPFARQRLCVLHAVVSSATRKPCIGPRLEHLEYYGAEGFTLGNYLEIKCHNTSKICHAKDCGLQDILHYDAFVHNDVRIQLFCERFVCPIAGQEESLLTWEFCKLCEAATPVSVVNDDAKAYSWAKLLEAHFYTRQSPSACPHPMLTDRIRYFAYRNLAFRIHVERIHPYEVILPGLRLFMRPDAQSRLRSEEALGVARRADGYFHSVEARLKSLELEIGLGREGSAAVDRHRPALDELAASARKGRREINELMLSEVRRSHWDDTLFLSKLRPRLQEIVVTVDKLFVQIEKTALPKERDVRRMTTNHLSRIFAEKEPGEKMDGLPGLPPAHEAEEHGGDGLPTAQPESSVAALARVVDTSVLGLPQFGLGFDLLSPSQSRSRTPVPSRTVSVSEPASAMASALPSEAPTPRGDTRSPPTGAEPSSSPDLPRLDGTVKGRGPAPTVDESDGNSSPTTHIKAAPLRPKPRRAKAPADLKSIVDSSCTETGEMTDSHPVVSSLVHRFDSPARQASPRPKPRRPAGSRSASSSTIPQLQKTVQPAVNTEKRSISRPTSPSASLQTRTPNTRPLSTRPRPGSVADASRQPPPSSFRAPNAAHARASESESDGTSIVGRLRMASSQGPNLPSAPPVRPTPVRRGSANQSTLRPQRRRVSAQSPTRTPSRVPIPSTDTRGRVSTIARHFDRINREAEKERSKNKRALALRARRALPPSASTARVAEYTSVTAAVESDESSDEDDRGGNASKSEADDGGEADSEDEEPATLTQHERVVSAMKKPPVTSPAGEGERDEGTLKAGRATSPAPTEAAVNAAEKLLPHLRDNVSSTPSADAERGSLLKTISSFWASRTGASLPLLEYPLSAEQHLFADSPLLLREDEPSSVIAFTLMSNQYQERMRSLRTARSNANMGEVDVGDTSMASWNIVVPTEDRNEEVEASLRMPEGVHLRFDYESGASRFHCRILFAEQFAALRRCCGCEESLVASLARCVKWDSTGGKSGMTFLKTQDDRLVLKQVSSSELASFGTFAPHYFAHMAECLMHGKPTTLAKIFGLFRISMRNAATGKSYKLDVVVMENLFYGRSCSRIFDLKGSLRNRYVKETGTPGEVLLDENLVEISRKNPLYIREASKTMLKQALKHDSDFLAAINIMDYSVIVGIDSSEAATSDSAGGDDDDDEHHELVVGIIDFLRSYTWDKRVETFVKEQGSLLAGGGAKGELPTVITPKQYAQRFLTFLDGVLLLSPDSWYAGGV